MKMGIHYGEYRPGPMPCLEQIWVILDLP